MQLHCTCKRDFFLCRSLPVGLIFRCSSCWSLANDNTKWMNNWPGPMLAAKLVFAHWIRERRWWSSERASNSIWILSIMFIGIPNNRNVATESRKNPSTFDCGVQRIIFFCSNRNRQMSASCDQYALPSSHFNGMPDEVLWPLSSLWSQSRWMCHIRIKNSTTFQNRWPKRDIEIYGK